eukprot:349233_1
MSLPVVFTGTAGEVWIWLIRISYAVGTIMAVHLCFVYIWYLKYGQDVNEMVKSSKKLSGGAIKLLSMGKQLTMFTLVLIILSNLLSTFAVSTLMTENMCRSYQFVNYLSFMYYKGGLYM